MVIYQLRHIHSGYIEPIAFTNFLDAEKHRVTGADWELWQVYEANLRLIGKQCWWNKVLDGLASAVYSLKV